MVKGKLIIIEAGDGCGKATQTKLRYNTFFIDVYPKIKPNAV